MAASVDLLKFPGRSPRLLFIPISLALLASVLIFFCISSTSRLMTSLHKNNNDHLHVNDLPTKPMIQISIPKPTRTNSVLEFHDVRNVSVKGDNFEAQDAAMDDTMEGTQTQLPKDVSTSPKVEVDDEVPDILDNRREESETQLAEESLGDQAGTPKTEVDDELAEESLGDDQGGAPKTEVDDEAADILDNKREDSETQLPEESLADPLIDTQKSVVDDETPDILDNGMEDSETQLPQKSLAASRVEEVDDEAADASDNRREGTESQFPDESLTGTTGNSLNNDYEVYHDHDLFPENYKEMNRSLKIYVYPHSPNERFANVLLPVTSEPGGNYASESYFKKALMKSHFITKDPSKADFFFLPFSITGMRHDKRIGVGGMQDYVREYVDNVKQKYPFWNRTGGADHFYVACHSIGKIAMGKTAEVKDNAIQVVCSSNYFVNGYVAHKDVSLPQIWPRQGNPPRVEPSKRKRLAFFAGASNSPTRKDLVKTWRNDTEIFAHAGRLKTSYETEFLRSKFCFHVKGFEVNCARIGDALYHGCVPVILADHYDLPFGDILDWKSFSVVVETRDIPLVKKILKGVDNEEYLRLQRNVENVRKHFLWHGEPIDYDCFHIVMYELWLRRSYVRVPLS